MLTADLVNARRKGAELVLASLDEGGRTRACAIAANLLHVACEHVGRTRDELVGALRALDVGPRETRLRDGLVKLIEDRCEFEVTGEGDAEALRTDVFLRASAARSALSTTERFDRARILNEVARQRGTTPEQVERGLFADLRGAHALVSIDTPSPETLVATYERAQAQAVLLRAVKVTIDVTCTSTAGLRALFRQLRFLRLLHTIERAEAGYRVVVDGPLSLFDSVTKYGLKLALLVPALDSCATWRLVADIRWGKERVPLTFRLAGDVSSAPLDVSLPDEVEALVRTFRALDTAWRVSINSDILDLPGVGMSIPDLVFERPHETGPSERVYLEVMGYWSREAVWRRINLVQSGLRQHVLFAVAAHLRVSEAVLDGDLPSALYVYKRTMNARTLAQRLEHLVTRGASTPAV